MSRPMWLVAEEFACFSTESGVPTHNGGLAAVRTIEAGECSVVSMVNEGEKCP